MFDQIKERLEEWLSNHAFAKRLAELEQKLLGVSTTEAVNEQLEQWGRQLVASFEERFAKQGQAELEALESRLNAELEKRVPAAWVADGAQAIENQINTAIAAALDGLRAELSSSPKPPEPPPVVATPGPAPLPEAPAEPATPPPGDGLPHPMQRDVFPTLAEYVAEGYYAANYEAAKKAWADGKAAASAPVAPEETGVSAPAE